VDLSNYRQRLNMARAIHAAAYPPHEVTEPAAVSVSIVSITFGTEGTITTRQVGGQQTTTISEEA
jgi:hypothetical protein